MDGLMRWETMDKDHKIELALYAATTVVAVSLSFWYHLPKGAYILSFLGYPLLRWKLGKPKVIAGEVMTPVSGEDEPVVYRGTKRLDEALSRANPEKGFLIPVAVGMDSRGKLIWGDMATFLNCLIAGLPRMGKSNFLEGVIQSTMHFSKNIVYLMVDFKQLGLIDYEKFGNTIYTASYEGLAEMLTKVIKVMNDRIKMFISHSTRKACKNIKSWRDDTLPWIFVIIDEAADISDSTMADELWELLGEIIRKGSAVGITVTLATQRPTATSIPGKISALLDSRFVMRVKTANESRYCNVVGANLLKEPGEMIVESRTINGIYKTLEVKDEDRVFDWVLEAAERPPIQVSTLVSSLTNSYTENKVNLAKNTDIVESPVSPLEAFKSLLNAKECTYELPSNKVIMDELGLTKWKLEQLKKESAKNGIIKKAGRTKYVIGDLK
jgi:hypothetical protein